MLSCVLVTTANCTHPSPLTQFHILGGLAVAGITFFAYTKLPEFEFSQTGAYDSWLASEGIKSSKVSIKCTGSGASKHCHLEAKKAVSRGDKMFQIPMSSVIQAASIVKETAFGMTKALLPHSLPVLVLQTRPHTTENVLDPESETAKLAFAEVSLPLEYMFSPFAVTFKLWHERKQGSSSDLAAWFDLMPTTPKHRMDTAVRVHMSSSSCHHTRTQCAQCCTGLRRSWRAPTS